MFLLSLVAASMQVPSAERGPWDNYSGPYKLVVTWYQSDLTVIDYPNRARCEKAKLAVEAEIARRRDVYEATLPQGSVSVGQSHNGAFCIPG